jgi:uncharacterized protein with HEPN domain
MPNDQATLLDIAKAAHLITAFVKDMTRESLAEDLKTQSAVLHQLTILGEAVKQLSREFRAQHAEIPWPLIAGMRDHLIHAYNEVDLDEVWKTATSDIPTLLADLKPLLPEKPQ